MKKAILYEIKMKLVNLKLVKSVVYSHSLTTLNIRPNSHTFLTLYLI